LTTWRTEASRALTFVSLTEAIQATGTTGAVLGLLMSYVRVAPGQGSLLLLAFWALRLPLHARALSQTLQRLPTVLASMGRLLEPLTADETAKDAKCDRVRTPSGGIALRLENVRVVLSAQEVLAEVTLEVGAGEHVAILSGTRFCRVC